MARSEESDGLPWKWSQLVSGLAPFPRDPLLAAHWSCLDGNATASMFNGSDVDAGALTLFG